LWLDGSLRFSRIQPPVEIEVDKDNTNETLESIAVKKKFRELCLRNMGINSKYQRVDIKVCSKHKVNKKTVLVKWNKRNNKQEKSIVDMYLPEQITTMEEPTTTTRGVGRDRLISRQIAATQESANNGDEVAEL
jgi:hypothetical protein